MEPNEENSGKKTQAMRDAPKRLNWVKSERRLIGQELGHGETVRFAWDEDGDRVLHTMLFLSL